MSVQKEVLLLLSICSNLVLLSKSAAITMYREIDGSSIINSMVVTLLEKCDLGIKNIVIYDVNENSSLFESVTALEPLISIVTVSEVKETLMVEDDIAMKERDMKIQGIISIVDPEDVHEWFFLFITTQWQCFKNCTYIIISKSDHTCSSVYVGRVLAYAARQYAFGIYYLCLSSSSGPVIFAYDQYGDSRPPPWRLFKQMKPYYRKGSIYSRKFQKDSICQGFHFNYSARIDLIRMSPLVGIPPWLIKPNQLADGIYNETIWKELFKTRRNEFDVLQRSTGLKFKYCVDSTRLKSVNGKGIYPKHFLLRYAGDFYIESIYFAFSNWWEVSDPINFDYYVILSHNTGFRTPLEKIANFYGRWTLISLTIILILTFIVIWFKVDTDNINFAGFDVLRLLINSGINVPINTSSFKIYFSMIFLYFMVMHATFSGHLAEFLTKPELRKNIDTIEDLKTSRIKTIYTVGFNYVNDVYPEILNKTEILGMDFDGSLKVQYDLYSAFIAAEKYLKILVLHLRDYDYKFYLSDNRLGSMMTSVAFRKGFPLIDRFNWALMYLRDTGNYDETIYAAGHYNVKLFSEMRALHFEADYRPITLNNLKPAFILLIVGNSLALIIFLFEILIQRYRKTSVKPTNVEIVDSDGEISAPKEGFKSLLIRDRFINYIGKKMLLKKQHDSIEVIEGIRNE